MKSKKANVFDCTVWLEYHGAGKLFGATSSVAVVDS